MAIKYSLDVNNARLDAIETTIGASPTLAIFDGAVPANCSVANVGNTIVTMTLPTDWMAAASGAAKAKNGTWQDTSADATGTAQYFRIFDGANCHIQGNCGATSSGADMELDNTSVSTGQQVTVSTFTINSGNYT